MLPQLLTGSQALKLKLTDMLILYWILRGMNACGCCGAWGVMRFVDADELANYEIR
jgi:hypothetical protein